MHFLSAEEEVCVNSTNPEQRVKFSQLYTRLTYIYTSVKYFLSNEPPPPKKKKNPLRINSRITIDLVRILSKLQTSAKLFLKVEITI